MLTGSAAMQSVPDAVAIDILERVVMPAMHVGLPEKFPPLDEDDLANLRKGNSITLKTADGTKK